MKNNAKPILIAGAGPTGLTLANLLARMEIPFLLIDKNPHPSRESKAFAVQARTLEIFDQLGIAQKAIIQGKAENTLHLLVKDKEVFKFTLNEILPGETAFPYILIIPQDQTEKLLEEALQAQQQQVLWEHELTHFKEDAAGVTATMKGPDGEEKQVQVQYLVGCDGARSTVREQAGFSFEGKTFSPTFYLADCELDWQFPHGDIYFTVAPGNLSIFFSFKEKNRYRLFNFLTKALDENKKELSAQEVQKILDANPYIKAKLKSSDWTSVFRIHARHTDSFRKGSIFLAGDAAHVHSPAGGQGMNTGIKDAYNLAWKLALVIRGNAAPALLETYHEERYVIAKNLHNTTDRFFQLIIAQHTLAKLFRLYVFPKLVKTIASVSWLRTKGARRISQIAVKYRFSSLSKEGKSGFTDKAPKPGDRIPYAAVKIFGEEKTTHQLVGCTQFTLFIAVADPDNEQAKQLCQFVQDKIQVPVQVHLLTRSTAGSSFFDLYGIQENALFIIRPDSHIGFRTSQLDAQEVENYFSEVLGKR
ncbi:FAD-dependent oxidoreductase [Pontibacter qinzhouensis]|uniref:FAD-dependent oxidoreductase n=1 Tax=Pontibacter qinzhouensis TaxID=2603253 RepID=A0A5C8K7C1_9BACT|nr:FAD-dependent monooxygenase [Pontibacter qinzhouensis]TXK48069.1 FAD-dependent oxidoreductase [Pontibacter qinzhouensis]